MELIKFIDLIYAIYGVLKEILDDPLPVALFLHLNDFHSLWLVNLEQDYIPTDDIYSGAFDIIFFYIFVDSLSLYLYHFSFLFFYLYVILILYCIFYFMLCTKWMQWK